MIRFLTAVILLLALPGLAVAFWGEGGVLVGAQPLWLPLAIGTVAGVAVDQIVFRRIDAIGVFEHELTHALAALLFLRRVDRFVVTNDRGGYVQHSGGFGGLVGNDFIGLAPYVLPTFTVASVLLRPLVPPGWFPWYDGWIGFTFGFHCLSTIRETAQAWHREPFASADGGELTPSDIASVGFVYSAIYIAAVTLAIHGVTLAIYVGDYAAVPRWAGAFWDQTLGVLRFLADLGERGWDTLRAAVA